MFALRVHDPHHETSFFCYCYFTIFGGLTDRDTDSTTYQATYCRLKTKPGFTNKGNQFNDTGTDEEAKSQSRSQENLLN